MTILFLCTGNSCRSQMAEGWARHLKGDVMEAFSAGVEEHGVNPYAVRVMAEAGVDISFQRSKTVDEFNGRGFTYVVTLCGDARERCPLFFGGTHILHRGFDDPAVLVREKKSEEEILAGFRRVRDEIKVFVEAMPEVLETPESNQ